MKTHSVRGFIVETLALTSSPLVLMTCAEYLSSPSVSAYAVAGGLVALALSGFATANTFGKIISDVDNARVNQLLDDSQTSIGAFIGRLNIKRSVSVKAQPFKI